MELRVTLAPNEGLRLILPTGRTLDVGATPASLRFIQRILMDVKRGRKEQLGYINEYPTQHIIEIWKKEDTRKRLEAEKERFADMGINVEQLDISL